MKTMSPPGYHHNGFVATHALGHMMYGFIYIYIYMESTPSRMKGFFSKEFFMRGLLGKISEEGLLYMVGTNDQICQKRSFINGFSNNLNTVNLFPNHVRVFT